MSCAHTNTRLVWTEFTTRLQRMDTRRLRKQCKDCGKLLSSDFPHAQAPPDTPNVDLGAASRALAAEEHGIAQFWNQRREQRERENEQWWDQYNEYLQTDAWQRRRQLVRQRANGLCEGCRERTATQVHHLSYRNVRNEFLWELVAICDECHRRAHNRD
jgi:5-methylcytosine-specific restriction endonuclease McrA